MKELQILRKDFIGIVNSINSDIEKQIILQQLKATIENFFDYLEEKFNK